MPMTKQEHLLVCLSEECSEVAHVVNKALRFGLHDKQPGQDMTNAQRIAQEFHDVLAIVEMLEADGAISRPTNFMNLEAKKSRVIAMMEHAKQCGTLEVA